MGTSVTQIDATYGHLVPDSEEYLRGLFDSYDHNAVTAAGGAAECGNSQRSGQSSPL